MPGSSKRGSKRSRKQEGLTTELQDAKKLKPSGTFPRSPRSFLLRKEDLQIGVCLLGIVERVFEDYVTVALPNRWKGRIFLSNISKELTSQIKQFVEADLSEDGQDLPAMKDIFSVGQYVLCAILKVEKSSQGKVDIALSVMPQHLYEHVDFEDVVVGNLLMGSVNSIEDHGCVVNFGKYSGSIFQEALL